MTVTGDWREGAGGRLDFHSNKRFRDLYLFQISVLQLEEVRKVFPVSSTSFSFPSITLESPAVPSRFLLTIFVFPREPSEFL